MNKEQNLVKIGCFIEDAIYIIAPFNNHVKFSKLYPNIEKSRKYITFLKPNPGTDLITDFVADFRWDGDNIIVERSDCGQYWRASIPIEKISIDKNYT
jgi:hypothetical protein